MIFIVLKRKRKRCEIFLMFTEEQLVNCVRHTCVFIQTYLLFNLLTKLLKKLLIKKSVFKDILEKQS